MVTLLTRTRGTVVPLLIAVISGSCGDTAPSESSTWSPEPSKQEASMTPELRAAYVAAVQANAGDMYHAVREPSGSARFVHASQGFEATLDGSELRLISQQASWEIALSTVGVGCEGESEIGLPAGAVEIVGNRVEIARPDVREWYVNGPLGLEQGFVVNRAPSCKGTGVVVTVDVGGSVAPALSDADGDGRGDAIVFSDADGVLVARYTDLFVVDATGKRFSAWMSVGAGSLSLHVDDAGAAYPLQIDPLIWVQQVKLLASDGIVGDFFGSSVALSGDTALVGARESDGGDFKQGSAYVFTRIGGVWTEQQKLTASDAANSEHFGSSVALSGDTALVGAPLDDIFSNYYQGSAYVFTRSGGVWIQQQKLTASDGAGYDNFGNSVALVGDTALVGAWGNSIGANNAQGSAYVFARNGVVWTQQQQLMASDGAASAYFGSSVALSGDTALVGASRDYIGMNVHQGSAYVFTRTGSVWTQQQKLLASDGAEYDNFGASVALLGDTALVGAWGDDIGANNAQGSAYVFARSGVVWTQQQQLMASDGAANDQFGASVALSMDKALIGAVYDDVLANDNQGSAYVFARNGGVWIQQQKLTQTDGGADDYFGWSVALLEDTALVGAQRDDVGMKFDIGSAYVFAFVVMSNGSVCTIDTECASGFCVDGVCCDTACAGGSVADCQACSEVAGAVANGTCVPTSGTTCNNGNACTPGTCQMGTCMGANPVVCMAMDECHDVGTCDSAIGMCSKPVKPNGTTCNDGNACTPTDSCKSGTCTGANPVVCMAMDECHDVGTCDSITGLCSNPEKPDGTVCSTGQCIEGVCKSSSSSSSTSGAGGMAGTGGTAGSGMDGGPPDDPSSCSCRAVASDSSSSVAFAGLALAATSLLRRRRK